MGPTGARQALGKAAYREDASAMIWLVLLIFPVMWWNLNGLYAKIHGHRLQTRYAWASQGALLFARRLPYWERSRGKAKS